MGVNHQTVVNFVEGVKPHPSTLRKFTTWYVKQSARTHLDAESFAAALAVLVEGYPPNKRAELRRQLLDVLREGYRAIGAEPPKWLK